jgi:molecular chaperone DnaK
MRFTGGSERSMAEQGHIIGIDLGTTNSVVAVIDGGQPRILINAEGQTKTPSIIGLMEDGEIVVGEMARRQAATQPERTISSVKRLIGRLAEEIEHEKSQFPYKLGENEEGYVTILVGDREYLPAELSAEVLKKLKADAEDQLGEPVERAVVTVPAYFDDLQRQATMEAARMAGLQVLRLLNEPTAAAMAYGLGRDGQHTVAVYDFGGGTFDFSILDIDHKTFEVMASTGNSQLGGDDLDALLMEWIAESFQNQTGVDLLEDPLTLRRLKDAAEQAKCELSTTQETLIGLPFIAYKDGNPIHLEMTVSREIFEELIEDSVEDSLNCCRRCLNEARLKVGDIDKVILVGGSTRIPLVQEMVEEFFGIAPFKGLNPDEIVAAGAATQGGVMNGELEDVVLLDVTPHSLGIEVRGSRMSTIVEKNSTIPIRVHKLFTTTEDDQPFVNIHVLQGESEDSSDCRSLGRFTLSGLESCRAGSPRIRVMFFINSDGILEIEAMDLQSGAEKKLTIHHAYLPAEERREAMQPGTTRRRRRRRSRAAAGESHGAGAPAPGGATSSQSKRPAAGIGKPRKTDEAVVPAAAKAEQPPVAASSPTPDINGAFAVLSDEARRSPDFDVQLDRQYTEVVVVDREGTSPPAVGVTDAGAAERDETEARAKSEQPLHNRAEQEAAATLYGAAHAAILEPDKTVPPELRAMIDLLGRGCMDPEAQSEYLALKGRFVDYCLGNARDLALQLLMARFHILTNQAEEAREVLDTLRTSRPEVADRLFDVYNELCRGFPQFLAARKDRATLAAAMGDYPTAMADLEFIAERDEENEKILERLRNVYELVLLDHADATIQFKLVKLHLRQQDLDAAIGLLQQLVMQAEYRNRANKVLGLCFWQKGMRHLAWQKFRNLELNDEMKDILYRLAEDMERHDELQHAKLCLERIYEVDINYRNVAELVKKLNFRVELQKDERYGGADVLRPACNDGGLELLGRFEVIGEVNRGSMGIVYKARDMILEEIVAIKVLNDFLCSDPQAVERFKQEARSARRLTHQNIVRIHDMFEHSSKKIISMEFIEGENLKELLKRNVTFTDEMVLNYLMQICEGLAYAHRLKVVHRDIKPANIMLTDRNLLKITDFGIAKLLNEQRNKSTTMIMGTPLYMSPEQIQGTNVTHRCDIYSLGVMLYEMVAGHPPFHEGNIEYQHLHNEPPPISRKVDKRLDQIIFKCLNKDPDQRFQTVEEVLTRVI